jgi:hypothetical protein
MYILYCIKKSLDNLQIYIYSGLSFGSSLIIFILYLLSINFKKYLLIQIVFNGYRYFYFIKIRIRY